MATRDPKPAAAQEPGGAVSLKRLGSIAALLNAATLAACSSIFGPDLDGRYDLVAAAGQPLPFDVPSGLCRDELSGTWEWGWLLVEDGDRFRIEWSYNNREMSGSVSDVGNDVWLLIPETSDSDAYLRWGSIEVRVDGDRVHTNLFGRSAPARGETACLTFQK